jgi:hypothetical protein
MPDPSGSDGAVERQQQQLSTKKIIEFEEGDHVQAYNCPYCTYVLR